MPQTISPPSVFFAGFLQFDVQSGETDRNLARVRAGLAALADSHEQLSPGIVVLPELWATGFAYDKLPALAGTIPELLRQLQELSNKYQVHIGGSLPEYAAERYYNTLFITDPAGTVASYRKQRLFSPMGEDAFFSPGTDPCPLQTSLGPVAGLVCYDLRFPELLRQQTARGPNLLVVPAQWPTARISHWRVLLRARAIENQMFVVAANRCGTTGDTVFGGHSMIVGPDGGILLEAGEGEAFRGTMLDAAMTAEARSLFNTAPEGALKIEA